MAKFSDGLEIKKWFGDFGGDMLINNSMHKLDTLYPPINKIEAILASAEFEEKFRESLALLELKPIQIEEFELEDGRSVLKAECQAKHYNLAAQMALAVLREKNEIFIGTYSRKLAEAAAELSSKLGLSLTIALSRDLCEDSELIGKLEGFGGTVDAKSCVNELDLPYYYVPGLNTPNAVHEITLEANFGAYPKPGLAGKLAGLFGEDLVDSLNSKPDCCAVYIDTGTGAIGTFKALMDTDCTLVTVESLVAQEYHTADMGAYTISTRNEDHDRNITICPELADWWRSGKVIRTGCDRVRAVDTDFLKGVDLSPSGLYAATLAFEKTECKKLLVLEEVV